MVIFVLNVVDHIIIVYADMSKKKKEVTGYKLKQEYPGSPMKGVTLVPDGKGGWVNLRFVGTEFEWRFPHLTNDLSYFEKNTAFWQKVIVEIDE